MSSHSRRPRRAAAARRLAAWPSCPPCPWPPLPRTQSPKQNPLGARARGAGDATAASAACAIGWADEEKRRKEARVTVSATVAGDSGWHGHSDSGSGWFPQYTPSHLFALPLVARCLRCLFVVVLVLGGHSGGTVGQGRGRSVSGRAGPHTSSQLDRSPTLTGTTRTAPVSTRKDSHSRSNGSEEEASLVRLCCLCADVWLAVRCFSGGETRPVRRAGRSAVGGWMVGCDEMQCEPHTAAHCTHLHAPLVIHPHHAHQLA